MRHYYTPCEMLLRAARQALRDHQPRDPYATPMPEAYADGKDIYDVPPAVDRLWDIRERRLHPLPEMHDLGHVIATSEFKGFGKDLDATYSRPDSVVYEFNYAGTRMAVYEVAPDGIALCWVD